MTRKAILLGLGAATALAAGVAFGDDLTSRALLERQQQSDAFALQLQQSLQSSGAGNLGPRERLELDALQRDQRQRQDELFYRQQVQTNSPGSDAFRRAEAMRADQERQQQLSRFRSDAAPSLGGEPAALQPAPLVDPAFVTAPIARAPADPAATATSPSADPARSEPLAMIRRLEDQADALWQAALQGDWGAAQDALGEVRRSVNTFRSDRFAAESGDSGGRLDALSKILDRLDTAIAGAETQLGARDGASVMRTADELMLTAAELVPDVARRPMSAESSRR